MLPTRATWRMEPTRLRNSWEGLLLLLLLLLLMLLNKVEKFLGGIFRNESDPLKPVIGARATKLDFISETNITEALINPVFSQVLL